MFSRVLLPSLFIGSLVSILMQLTCMWPVTILSRELSLSAHRILYASAAAMFLCNGFALPLLTAGRLLVRARPNFSTCLACCIATVALAAGSAVLLVVASFTKAFFLARLSTMSQRDLQATVGRYLGSTVTVWCVAWPGCRNELAGHMRVLLLSAAFYNALACLLLVANACLTVRGILVNKWLLLDEEEESAAAAAAAAEAAAADDAAAATAALPEQESTTSEAVVATSTTTTPRTGDSTLSAMWIAMQ